VKKTSLNQIQEFLKIKKIAVVGYSRNPKSFARVMSQDLAKQGYEIIPINVNADEIKDVKCYESITAAGENIDGILIMTKKNTAGIIDEAAAKGIKHIWLRHVYISANELEEIEKKCDANGINLITNHCPYMFLENAAFPHTFHRFLMKMTGSYPKVSAEA
jgi:predicted CoA-binding protein